MIRPKLFAAALALAAVTDLAAAQVSSPETTPSPREVWDLTRLFPDDARWDAERVAVTAELPALRALQGTLARDAAALAAGLNLISAVNRRMQRMWVYASTQASTDNGNRRNQERTALMATLAGQLGAALAWVEPEIQSLGAERAEAFLRSEPALAPHERRIRNAIRLAAHTLAPETEAALAANSPVLAATTNPRSLLVNADIEWPVLKVDGREVRVSDTGYGELRQHPDRRVRMQAFEAFYKTYGQYENTLGALLAQRVNAGVINARLRRHPSAVAASLAPNEIPESVVRTLVAEVNRALPTLHRYFKLRQRALQLPDLHYYDVYPEMVRSDVRYPLEQASALTLAAMKPLGDEYQQLLTLALGSRTMHLRPARGKSSGAYATSVYGQTPFIFLNHQETYDSLSTFAHEWGHGLHSMLAQRAQPFETAGYSLFLAEIASMTNEVLLNQHMLDRAGSKAERIFLLDRALERVRGGFFRQAMFAEFELNAHDAQQRGEALNGKRFTQMYCELLRKYHGSVAGVMAIDPRYCVEWAFIPHFHRPFYVFAYATSLTAATHFGGEILAGKAGARDNYLNVLRAGSSVPPHALLLKAGLDLSQPAPYRAIVARMEAAMDELEKLLD